MSYNREKSKIQEISKPRKPYIDRKNFEWMSREDNRNKGFFALLGVWINLPQNKDSGFFSYFGDWLELKFKKYKG